MEKRNKRPEEEVDTIENGIESEPGRPRIVGHLTAAHGSLCMAGADKGIKSARQKIIKDGRDA